MCARSRERLGAGGPIRLRGGERAAVGSGVGTEVVAAPVLAAGRGGLLRPLDERPRDRGREHHARLERHGERIPEERPAGRGGLDGHDARVGLDEQLDDVVQDPLRPGGDALALDLDAVAAVELEA